MAQSSHRGAVWERGKEHMCCATPSLNGAFAKEQLSIHVKTKATVKMHVLSDICTYMGSVCVVGCVYLGLGVCVYVCEQVYMSVSATLSFPHPSDPTRRKGCRWPEDSQGCTVYSVICTEVA